MSILKYDLFLGHLTLHICLLRQVGGHGERGEVELVGDVDGGAALHGHVEHLHVVEHDEDVGHGAAVDVLHVGVAALCQNQSVALLLKISKLKSWGFVSYLNLIFVYEADLNIPNEHQSSDKPSESIRRADLT